MIVPHLSSKFQKTMNPIKQPQLYMLQIRQRVLPKNKVLLVNLNFILQTQTKQNDELGMVGDN